MEALRSDYDDRVRDAINSSDVTPAEVARAVGTYRFRVGEIMVGEFRPSSETREALEEELDIDLTTEV